MILGIGLDKNSSLECFILNNLKSKQMELKRAKVVMLPTKDKSHLFQTNYTHLHYSKNKEIGFGLNYQHLYITTDEEIKESDYVLSTKQDYNLQLVPKHSIQTYNNSDHYFKIIATTDKSLYEIVNADNEYIPNDTIQIPLPQPSQAFIEKYCKVGGIDEVMIEYEFEGERCSLCGFSKESNECINRAECPKLYFGGVEILKVNSHNEITIHPIKDSWTREEVKDLIVHFNAREGYSCPFLDDNQLNNWIKENLYK